MSLDGVFAFGTSLEIKPRRRQKRREVVQEHLANLHLLNVNRSAGRENEKILKETEVGTKEEKADQGFRKVPGKDE